MAIRGLTGVLYFYVLFYFVFILIFCADLVLYISYIYDMAIFDDTSVIIAQNNQQHTVNCLKQSNFKLSCLKSSILTLRERPG